MSDKYFADLPADELANELMDRWEKFVTARAPLEQRWKRNYEFYNNRHFGELWDGGGISHGGEHGEFTNVKVNIFRNIIQHQLNLITSTKPAFQTRAINNDSESLAQAKLGNSLLDYYLKEKALTQILKRAVEDSLINDAGYVKVTWDVSGGEEYSVDMTDRPVREGDLAFSNPTAWDVMFQIQGITQFKNNHWVVERSVKNKWDLIASYPEAEEEIKAQTLDRTEDAQKAARLDTFTNDDDIYIWEFFHKKTAALANGRYMMFCADGTVLMDSDLPYREIPMFQITAGVDLQSQFGRSGANDLAPIQENINANYSIIATNQENFGHQHLLIPRESNASPEALTQGLSAIFYDSIGGAPTSVNFTNTAPEVFNHLTTLERQMETLSGVNSVVRGNPDANLSSGTALALVQSQAIQFANHQQEQYISLMEDVGTAALRILRDFASSPRVVAIVGKHNQTSMEKFTGDDLQSVNRVLVEPGNPMSRTVAGRMELANQVIQTGLLKTPEQYFTVLETGNLDSLTQSVTGQNTLVNIENEDLMEGRGARAMITDSHRQHILEHMNLLNNPAIRANNEKASMILSHVQEHIDMLSNPALANLFSVLGIESLPPMGMPGMAPGGPASAPGADPAVDPAMLQATAQQPIPAGVRPPVMPNPAQPPQG